ncbi:TetR/AcrR family transcriptional regulator [Streptomyces sp. B6B3]|uniref:TetR/AcrR family transcriptional regulator n=1 Tax=Streptomyces sp. B6B3 TaxID=3153570 RepID=UPI00325DDEDB
MTPERELELLTTALEVLREVGYEALTMDAVAARGHCSKATLYRQWQNKQRLVAAALHATRPVDASVIDTGTLRGDLVLFVSSFGAQAAKDTPIVAGLAHASLVDDDLAQVLRESLIGPEHGYLTALVQRAVDRGELAALPAATPFVPQVLVAALISRPLLEGDFADVDYLVRLVDSVVLPALLHS